MKGRFAVIVMSITAVSACGGSATEPTHVGSSPPSVIPSSAAPTPTAVPPPPVLVIEDFGSGTLSSVPQVRLARVDAVDVGTMRGEFVGVVDDTAIALDGVTLRAMTRDGVVRSLGTLAAPPSDVASQVVVSPDLSQWLYTTTTTNGVAGTAVIHLGSAAGDRVVATLPSPDQNGIFMPFAWTSAGPYAVLQATGIGGAGPFLDYHFPLYRLDLAAGTVAPVAPSCVAVRVLASGSIICATSRADSGATGYDVRSAAGSDHVINAASPNADLTVSADESRIALAGLGGTATDAEYQVRVGALTSTSVSDFGPPGYVPQAWLPDGRLIARHMCLVASDAPTSCVTSRDGATVILSADGLSSTPFFQFAQTVSVVGVLG